MKPLQGDVFFCCLLDILELNRPFGSFFYTMQGKTVIAIAHRLSTIAHLDRLIVMDDGQIVEDGTHEELLSRDGLYARLWRMQSGGFLYG